LLDSSLCIEARAAVAELKQCGELIPNQAMLINTIPVLEAQASSEIENIVTTADRLFQFANSPDTQIDAATKEALRYGKALYSGFESLSTRPLTKQTAISLFDYQGGRYGNSAGSWDYFD
jgi:Fic family protein